jgi:DNA-binding MarR family transcriptional regulator
MNHSYCNMLIDPSQSTVPRQTVAIADQIRWYCSVITKVARADLESRLKGHDSGISAIEHGVLRHLVHGITSMAEIGRQMGVAPSTLVYVVDGLVKKKLIRRSKDPNDRRREPLQIEKRGADLFAKIPKMEASSVLVQRLDSMKRGRRRELVLLLKEFVEGLAGAERLSLSAEPNETTATSHDAQDGQAVSAAKVRKPRS